jgi:hypothetical protein
MSHPTLPSPPKTPARPRFTQKELDRQQEKLMLTFNPSGYLRRT